MSTLKPFLVVLILFVSIFPILTFTTLTSSEDIALSAINRAEEVIASAYQGVLEAEKARADVSDLLARLNAAGELLAEARTSYRIGDFDGAVRSANLCYEDGEKVRVDAYRLRDLAVKEGGQRFRWTIIWSFLGMTVIVCASFVSWHIFKRRYSKQILRTKLEVVEMMRIKNYRTLFATTSLVLILIAAFPALSMVVPFPRSSERFSELWVLGQNHAAEDYPFNITTREQYRVFVGIGNHMGSSAYYIVYVKFRNQTQPLPDTSNSKPSSLPPLYEFQVFAADGATWENPVNFSILEVSRLKNSCLVRRMSINDVVFSVNSSSKWDSERSGFYYQFFFELWLYNATLRSFQFHNRFVGIWLNMTGS